MRQPTTQEEFWSGTFGDEYTERNQIVPETIKGFFANVLGKTYGVRSICELGANKGHNLDAIYSLSSNYELTGVELNRSAYEHMAKKPYIRSCQSRIQDFSPDTRYDFVFTCGVLIHIAPSELPKVYEKMFQLSNRYILLNEYFSQFPVELEYRGHREKLFKRDFASELLDQYSGQISVVDYGFLWQRLESPWDNLTWFLLQKH
jgi:pseudaminic acid biosynthesis-associated methylase